MEISKEEKQRALNMVWNAAKDYSLLPALRVYDAQGKADLYWNSIIGALYAHYDFSRFAALFRAFEGHPVEYQLKNLFWLGLENAAYARELPMRPALEGLRRSFAQSVLAQKPSSDPTLYERVERARCALFLGEAPQLSPYCERLCALLDFDAAMDSEAICARAEEIFALYFRFEAEEAAEKEEDRPEKQRRIRLPSFLRLGKKKGENTGEGRAGTARPRIGALNAEYADTGIDPESLDYHLSAFNVRSESELRSYMENFFGVSLYTPAQIASMEKSLCTGNHSGCHLHYTRGEFNEKTGYKSKDDYLKMTALRQLKRNRAYYAQHAVQAQENIARLASRIRNAMLTHLESSTVKAAAGRLDATRAWRYAALEDESIFQKELRADSGDITVDILLDGSNSQSKRQERLATQAYIIAESLTRCALPVRLYSFCSLRGFTVFRIFRDYAETGKNENVFCYFTAGCNRDGLAVRAAHDMLQKSPSEHRLLILLSDARPNGLQRVRLDNGEYRGYTDELGVRDTAAEVRAARRSGVCVLCVFTGEDDALPSAKLIYGTGFSRITELEHFADTVGTLIQNEIKNF